jgi:hypothetical protein
MPLDRVPKKGPRRLPVHRESCGTLSGRNAHVVAGEQACTACKAVHAAYMKDYREKHRRPPRNGAEIDAAARKTATRQLLEEFSDRFEELYEAAVEVEARRAANAYPQLVL